MRWSAILFILAACSAGAETLPIKTWTTADGLASDRITCIVADSRGFLWFCTPEGLSRFDGSRFVTYGVHEGLPDRAVVALRESRSGDLWVATARGLSRIAGGLPGARFASDPNGEGVAARSFYALAESRSGEMWATSDAGLFAWSDPGRPFQPDLPTPRVRMTTLVEDPNGDVWAGSPRGIFVLPRTGAARAFTVKDGLPGVWVEMLLRDSRGNIWAALRGGLVEFSEQAPHAWHVEHVYTTELAGMDVKAVYEASDGIIWAATTRGISRLRREGGRTVIENLTRAQGLSDRSITSLAEDQAGNMWAGTESAGVMRIGRFGFTTYGEQDGLGSDRVWSVLEGRAGELVAVTIPQAARRERSVDVFDGHRFQRVAPAAFANNAAWSMNTVLLQSRSGEWWAATHEGFCRYRASDAAHLDRQQPLACYAVDASIFTLFEDSSGGIWASAQSLRGDRLMRWDPRTGLPSEFPYPRVAGEAHLSVPDDLVSAFAEDDQAQIWMGLYKGGVYRYKEGTFHHVLPGDGVPNGPVLALLAAGSNLWIGTDGAGLGRITNTHDPHPHADVYTTAQGLSSDIVDCLVEDRAGHIYAGTGRGVDRLDPLTAHIRHFSSVDGLAHGACHGALRDRAGSIWFSTTQGLSRLVPGDDPRPLAPHILITDARIGGKAHAVSLVGETRIVLPALQPSANEVQVEFVGIDHDPGAVVRYAYKLEGADTAWGAPSSQANVSYAGLGAGTYRFLVKAVTAEGVESPVPAEIDFAVLAPVWRRWWFVGLAAALTAAVAVAAHRYRAAQLVNVERMRTAIATDLHDDLGASLSQIAILSEVARLGAGRPGSGEPLERIASLARELVDSVGEIVWSIRSEPDGWDALVRHMREFALDVLVSQGVELHFSATSGHGPSMSLQARRQLFLMFKECIHNVARHSHATSVVAELRSNGRDVVLTVEDNGVGSNGGEPTARRSGGTGIAGMQRRAERLGGRMRMTSTAGRGCRVEIHLPC